MAPLTHQIIDEIALEGLEGITLPTLWVYLSAAVQLELPLPEKFEAEVWDFIKTTAEKKKQLLFYELPVERPTYKLFDRFSNIDSELGIPIAQTDVSPMHYKCVPVQDGEILGSCEHYKERKRIPVDQVKPLSAKDVLERWGTKFVIVASQKLRYYALTPLNVLIPNDLTPVQYIIWEAIGRSRANGEATSGTCSLLHFCKDSTIVFYIKNKLIQSGLITYEPFNELRNGRLTTTAILTLPRFYMPHKSRLAAVIEKLFFILKDTPNHRLLISEALVAIHMKDNVKSFRKISTTHLFRRIFETQIVPASGHEEPKDDLNETTEQSKGRTAKMIILRDPNMEADHLFIDDEDEKEESVDEFYCEKYSYIDMPVKDEFYRAVARHGTRGCSQTEICNFMSMHHLTIRQIVKSMLADGLIKSYIVDSGRQRTNMYVVIENYASVKKQKDDSAVALQNLQCADEPNIPVQNDVILNDIPTIVARIKPFSYDIGTLARDAATQRQLERKMIIVKTIDEKCISPFNDIRVAIQRAEKEQGHKDEVCQKSVRRLLSNMAKSNILNLFMITLQYNEHARIYQYVTHPRINMEHEVLQREVLKLKNNFFLAMEDRRLRNIAQEREQQKKLGKKKKLKDIEQKSKDLIRLNAHKPPKFLISRYMHELLFYIVVELNERQPPKTIDEELVLRWQQSEPALNIRDYMQLVAGEDAHVTPYTEDISWRTFIAPLPTYSDKPAGWVYFFDAMDRIPLSIFNKIFRIDKGSDGRLAQYLTHPIRQHYVLRQLPVDLQCMISRSQLQRTYTTVMKLLNNMGLVQVSDRKGIKDPLVLWVYFNRRTQILDTTTSEASYAKINPERQYESVHFEFKQFENVQQYWTTLQRVCVYTKLGFRRKKTEKLDRIKDLAFVCTTDFDEAPSLDNGEIPGDHSGAAGLSTNLFAHTFRNWSWVVHTQVKTKMTRYGRSKLHRSAQPTRKIRTHITVVKGLPVAAGAGAGSGGGGSATIVKRSRTVIRDSIDRDALKNMRTLRVSWRKDEDHMLKISRAVYLYVAAPVAVFGLLAVGKICRDVMRHHLGSYNKTSQACVRRIQFIIKMNRHVPEVPTWLHTLQTHPHMQRTYGDDFLKKLKRLYANRSEYCEALAKHFVLIYCFLYRQVHNIDGNTTPNFAIPDTVAEFHKLFTTRTSLSEDQVINYSNPTSEFDLQVIVVLNVLHSTLCCATDKTHYNLQAFEIYKHFSEDVLHAAFTRARSEALVVPVKRKNIQLIPTQMAGPAYVLSSKYRTRLIALKIPYHVYDALSAYLKVALSHLFAAKKPSSPLELKSPQLGQLILLAESISQNYFHLTVKLPNNILTVDAEQRQTLSPMDRILDHYHSIFDNAPETEYIKNYESEPNERQVRVKFHPANLSYKINYSPYDHISKLPMRYLHFFCALDHLEKDVQINFSKLQRQDDRDGVLVNECECPFNCVMKSSNYVNEIERIVGDKKSQLPDLIEMAPQKLLNQAMSGCSVKVEATNLLTLVRMLESFWHEKELENDRRDFGKFPSKLKVSKPLDWQSLCNEIVSYKPDEDDYDKNDEYEPTLNKEERIVRAQDVFVVNLPVIQVEANAELVAAKDTVVYGGVRVPKIMVGCEVERARILQKIVDEAHWKYTENSFETLQPHLAELDYKPMEQQHLHEIHNFISGRKYGVTIFELLSEFPYEKFLVRALHTLAQHYLIKRVGVASFMYIHKDHIRQWLVHSFHIKRLERENLGATAASTSLKRLHDDHLLQDDDANEEPSNENKRVKLEQEAQQPETSDASGKRRPKPVKRFENTDDKTAKQNEPPKEVIVIKPQPWIRLIGSLNRRVLDRWLGSILTECVARSGCSVHDICVRFPHMLPVDIMFLLEILTDLRCIHLTQIEAAEVNLFSVHKDIQEKIVTELYDPERTYVTAHPDALMRMTLFIGNKKYNKEFI